MKSETLRPLPASFELSGETYEFEKQFKSDWLSAVGLYRGESQKLILKCYRARSLWGVPVRWLTSRMASREIRILAEVQGLEGVPREFGVFRDVGILHEFLEGHPLRPDEKVRPDFFERLDQLVAAIHARGIAYVDLSKRDNVLVGADGGPCLIDFQIAWIWPGLGFFGRILPDFAGKRILAGLQEGDLRHVLKHRRRVQPESLTSEQREELENPRGFLSLHRKLVRPYQKWRRRRQRARA